MFIVGFTMLFVGGFLLMISLDAEDASERNIRLGSIITVIVGAIIVFHYGKIAFEKEREYMKNNCVLVGNYPKEVYMCKDLK